MPSFDDLKKDDINLLNPNLGSEEGDKQIDSTFDFAQITSNNIPLEPDIFQKSADIITTPVTNIVEQQKNEKSKKEILEEKNIDGKNGLFVVKDPFPTKKSQSQKKKKKNILPVILAVLFLLVFGLAAFVFVVDKDMGQNIINIITGNNEQPPIDNSGTIVAPTPEPTPTPIDEPEPVLEPEKPEPSTTPSPIPTPTPAPVIIPQPILPTEGGLG